VTAMDFPSLPAAGMAGSNPEQLNLLDNDNLLLDLDDKTLQVTHSLQNVCSAIGWFVLRLDPQ
jgi:hypothetical protein